MFVFFCIFLLFSFGAKAFLRSAKSLKNYTVSIDTADFSVHLYYGESHAFKKASIKGSGENSAHDALKLEDGFKHGCPMSALLA